MYFKKKINVGGGDKNIGIFLWPTVSSLVIESGRELYSQLENRQHELQQPLADHDSPASVEGIWHLKNDVSEHTRKMAGQHNLKINKSVDETSPAAMKHLEQVRQPVGVEPPLRNISAAEISVMVFLFGLVFVNGWWYHSKTPDWVNGTYLEPASDWWSDLWRYRCLPAQGGLQFGNCVHANSVFDLWAITRTG